MHTEKPQLFFAYKSQALDQRTGINIAEPGAYFIIRRSSEIIEWLVGYGFDRIALATLPEDSKNISDVKALFPYQKVKIIDGTTKSKLIILGMEVKGYVCKSKVIVLGKEFDMADPQTYSSFECEGLESTIVIWAAKKGHMEVVKAFLSMLPSENKKKEILVLKANLSYIKHNIMVEIYNKFPVDFDSKMILCGDAISSGNKRALKFYLDQDVKSDLKLKQQLLQVAVNSNKYEMVKLLIKRGVDVKAENNRAVDSARDNGYERIVKLLVKHEAPKLTFWGKIKKIDRDNSLSVLWKAFVFALAVVGIYIFVVFMMMVGIRLMR